MTVLVIGAGFAGTAAAWQLARLGVDVALAWDRAGASELYSGALDAQAWGSTAEAVAALEPAEAEFLTALGIWVQGAGSGKVATGAGLVRSAQVRDTALLDLEPLRGGSVAVLDLGRPGWDAELLASAWSASPWAQQSATRFSAVRLAPPSPQKLRLLSEFDLSACFDEPAWQGAFGQSLRMLDASFAAALMGPWLGHAPESAVRLRHAAGRQLGETLSEPGGAAGLRFVSARDAWLGRARIPSYRGLVYALEPTARGWSVRWVPEGSGAPEPLGAVFQAVVLAVGGVLGGGIRYAVGPESAAQGAFSLSFAAPLELRLDGRDVRLLGGSDGADLVALGMGALERVGVAAEDSRVARQSGLFAAGDVVAGRPRSGLEAVRAGIRAASALERDLAAGVFERA